MVSPSSQQMLGTIRINGLETQVRAIQKLPDYSKNRSPRRKRLIEAQSWKRGELTAIALIPGVGERASGERSLHRGGCGLPRKKEPGLKACSIGPGALASPSLNWSQVAAFSSFSQHCTFSALLSHKSLRKPSLRGVFPFTYAVHTITRVVSHYSACIVGHCQHRPRDFGG